MKDGEEIDEPSQTDSVDKLGVTINRIEITKKDYLQRTTQISGMTILEPHVY